MPATDDSTEEPLQGGDRQSADSTQTRWGLGMLAITAILVGMALMALQSRRPVRHVAPPPVIRIIDVTETEQADGWFVDGVAWSCEGAPLPQAGFALRYEDEHGTPQSAVLVDIANLQPGERRTFHQPIPGYRPGLRRIVVEGAAPRPFEND